MTVSDSGPRNALPKSSSARRSRTVTGQQQVAVFRDEEKDEAVDETEDLPIVVLGLPFAGGQTGVEGRVGRMGGESGAEGTDGGRLVVDPRALVAAFSGSESPG